MSWRQLPNCITGARLLLVLPLVWSMQGGEYRAAFWIALLAGLSDALDGGLAKRYGWQTPLGALLDPLADKVLIAACFVGLWGAGVMPGWLLALVLGRDAVIVAGALAYHALVGPLEPRPIPVSKLTTAAQIALALFWLTALAWIAAPIQALPPLAFSALHALVATLTAASGLCYVWIWSRRAWRARGGEKAA